ncbi:MAG: M20/M25/M40 family metallo-hydrolase [Halobacteria archaeon]|nr:M20/M25/M40 family metallo-hydrolase [Halobacteria archaeon]
MKEVEKLTRTLVKIPSHEDETQVGDEIEEWLRRQTSAEVERDGKGNVIARKGEGEKSLALVGHHDVVPPSENQMEGDEYRIEERNGRLYGRGTADMKGSVSAQMLAFRDADPSHELVFVSFVGEEKGGIGARYAIENGFSPDYAVVGEGSTGYSTKGVTDVAVAHKGRRQTTVKAKGKSAHASEVEKGENAIYRCADAINIVRELDFPTVELYGEKIRGSVAVTQIEGGSAINVIPDGCSFIVDERTVPGNRANIGEVEGIEGVKTEVDQDLPPMECDDGEFAKDMKDIASESQEGDPKLVTKPHATDAGWLSQAGTTCVVCGPAEPGEAHTSSESVGIDILERCYRIYREVGELRV